MTSRPIRIAGIPVGQGHPPRIVAELSGNHNGSLERMLDLMAMAAEAGADAIKIQTYTADTLTIDHDSPDFMIQGGPWDGRTLYDLYREAHTPWAWHPALFAKGRELGIPVFSSPFDPTALDLLEGLAAPAYKIASFELVDLPLIERVARTGKPMIMSTGIADAAEIEEAVAAARSAGCRELILLHCVSAYPTPPEASNLCALADLATRFEVMVGLSDHTLGTTVAVAAVALGAAMIEKHVTLSRTDGGADASFSLEPEEFRHLCTECRTAWRALGAATDTASQAEQGNRTFRRSLYVVADVAAGEILTEDNVRSIRPSHGLPPKHLAEVLGRRASRDLKRGERLTWDMVAPLSSTT